MQEKKSTKPNKLEDITNLKSLMSLNDSLFEATKTAIRTKNNEIALKMIENLSDRPDLWMEYLSVRWIF
jgi:hypothetical protein